MSVAGRTAPSSDIRLALLEGEVSSIKGAVGDLKTSIGDLANSFGAMRNEMARAPRSVPYREMVGAVAATLAALAIVAGYANWWMFGAVDPVKRDLARVERSVDPSELAIMRYRISELEKRMIAK